MTLFVRTTLVTGQLESTVLFQDIAKNSKTMRTEMEVFNDIEESTEETEFRTEFQSFGPATEKANRSQALFKCGPKQ